jgi:hypothetical protein
MNITRSATSNAGQAGGVLLRFLGDADLGQHVLQGLMVRLGNRLFHPFHILGFRLEQPADIVLDRSLYRPGSPAEMAAEALAEVQEALTDPGQQPHLGIRSRVFLNPFALVSFMIHLMKPCSPPISSASSCRHGRKEVKVA